MILKVVVEVPDECRTGQFKTLLRNSIELPDSLQYDYQSLIKGLKLLYPNKQLIINFTIL